eukprot:1444299-Pyramimonas_sp.AAC.2
MTGGCSRGKAVQHQRIVRALPRYANWLIPNDREILDSQKQHSVYAMPDLITPDESTVRHDTQVEVGGAHRQRTLGHQPQPVDGALSEGDPLVLGALHLPHPLWRGQLPLIRRGHHLVALHPGPTVPPACPTGKRT